MTCISLVVFFDDPYIYYPACTHVKVEIEQCGIEYGHWDVKLRQLYRIIRYIARMSEYLMNINVISPSEGLVKISVDYDIDDVDVNVMIVYSPASFDSRFIVDFDKVLENVLAELSNYFRHS